MAEELDAALININHKYEKKFLKKLIIKITININLII